MGVVLYRLFGCQRRQERKTRENTLELEWTKKWRGRKGEGDYTRGGGRERSIGNEIANEKLRLLMIGNAVGRLSGNYLQVFASCQTDTLII